MKVKLKDVCSVVVPLRDKPKKFTDESRGIPWCRIEDIEGKYLNGTKSGQYVDTDTIASMNLKVFPAGTVLCAVTGASIGTFAITTRELITNQTFAGLVCGPKIYNQFLYYYVKLLTKVFVDMSVGCAQAYIKRETFEDLDIDLPPFDEQVMIVKLLEGFDDRITNNTAISSYLESMTKLIYDYWFVQFDFPDENGKPYKSSGGKMVWSTKLQREIPEGWQTTLLGEKCKVLLGGTPDTGTPEYWNGEIPWLSSGEAANSPVVASEKTITAVGKDKSTTAFAKAGAVVMSITRYIRPAILGIDACFNQSVVAVLPTEDLHTSFLYPFMKSQVPRYLMLRTGAQHPHINQDIVKHTPFLCPPTDLLNRYNKVADILVETQIEYAKQTKQLVELRDWLLPMLMNGQVKVSPTETGAPNVST